MEQRNAIPFLVALFAASTASAQDELWAVQASNLYAIDVDGLRADLVGFVGSALVGGIGETEDGTVYATQFLGLDTVDPTSGAGTFRGPLLPQPEFYGGVAVDPTNDRLYYAAGIGFAVPDSIHEVRRDTLQTKTIVSTPRFRIAGLEFDAAGTLFALDADADELFVVDLVEGTTSVPTPGGLGAWPRLSSLAIGRSGRMYSIHNDARLIEIDPATGLGTDIGLLNGLALGEVSALSARDPHVLAGTPDAISLAAGGAQSLVLDVGVVSAGATYLVLGSASGSLPGTVYSGLVVPLNSDGYTTYTLENPNSPLLAASLGTLDSWGRATATFALPPASDPTLAGLVVHHAGLVVGAAPAGIGVIRVTQAASCRLTP